MEYRCLSRDPRTAWSTVACQGIPRTAWKPNVHFRAHNGTLLFPILRMNNPVHALPFYFF